MFKVENLTIQYGDHEPVVLDVSFSVDKGESIGLIGESGSGKTTIALALIGLLPPNGKITSGKIYLNNINLSQLDKKELEKIRGKEISIIFQDPYASLNPVLTIGEQIKEVFYFRGMRQKAKEESLELLKLVKIKNPELVLTNYPHQLSGGMLQRVMIAIALANKPKYLIADEPTTALDVIIQKDILNLIQEIKNKLNFGLIYITHNFAITKMMCENLVVLHEGKEIEKGKTIKILSNPQKKYTQQLIQSVRKIRYG